MSPPSSDFWLPPSKRKENLQGPSWSPPGYMGKTDEPPDSHLQSTSRPRWYLHLTSRDSPCPHEVVSTQIRLRAVTSGWVVARSQTGESLSIPLFYSYCSINLCPSSWRKVSWESRTDNCLPRCLSNQNLNFWKVDRCCVSECILTLFLLRREDKLLLAWGALGITQPKVAELYMLWFFYLNEDYA